MTRIVALLLAFVIVISSAGCTLVGAVVGGAAGSHTDHQHELQRVREGKQADDGSVGSMVPGTLAGAGLGLVLDIVAVSLLMSSIDRSIDETQGTTFTTFGWSND
jgi:hypothetical protein